MGFFVWMIPSVFRFILHEIWLDLFFVPGVVKMHGPELLVRRTNSSGQRAIAAKFPSGEIPQHFVREKFPSMQYNSSMSPDVQSCSTAVGIGVPRILQRTEFTWCGPGQGVWGPSEVQGKSPQKLKQSVKLVYNF